MALKIIQTSCENCFEPCEVIASLSNKGNIKNTSGVVCENCGLRKEASLDDLKENNSQKLL